MTKETKSIETTEKVQDIALVSQNEIAKHSADLSLLDKLKPTVAVNFNYLNLEEGESRNFLFMGFSFINVQDEKNEGESKELEVIKLIDSKKSLFVLGAVAIVSDLKNANLPIGTPIGITYLGKEKRTKKFDIRLLA